MIRRGSKNLIMLVAGIGTFLSFEAIAYKYSTNEYIRVLQSEIEKTTIMLEETQAELDESYQQLDEIIDTVLEDKQKIKDLEEQLEEKDEELEKLKRPVTFNSYDVTEPSGTTVYHMRKALEGTALYDYAELFCAIEKEYGINAYLLPSIAAQESSWGTSNRAVNDNNLTGLEVYEPVSRGYVSDSKYDNLIRTAELLSSEYLSKNGKYYNGLSVYDINTKYCYYEDKSGPNYKWSDGVISIANQLIDKANGEE